jgi:acyl-CoA reductase-like NAD-dependent aldehyde dehydrogenase
VYRVSTDAEAVALANDSSYGLNAAVHSSSWEHAYTVASQLEYGQVHINSLTSSDARKLPPHPVPLCIHFGCFLHQTCTFMVPQPR